MTPPYYREMKKMMRIMEKKDKASNKQDSDRMTMNEVLEKDKREPIIERLPQYKDAESTSKSTSFWGRITGRDPKVWGRSGPLGGPDMGRFGSDSTSSITNFLNIIFGENPELAKKINPELYNFYNQINEFTPEQVRRFAKFILKSEGLRKTDRNIFKVQKMIANNIERRNELIGGEYLSIDDVKNALRFTSIDIFIFIALLSVIHLHALHICRINIYKNGHDLLKATAQYIKIFTFDLFVATIFLRYIPILGQYVIILSTLEWKSVFSVIIPIYLIYIFSLYLVTSIIKNYIVRKGYSIESTTLTEKYNTYLNVSKLTSSYLGFFSLLIIWGIQGYTVPV